MLTSLMAHKSGKWEIKKTRDSMNKIKNPPCNILKATSFIMPDETKKKDRVVVGGESSCHVDGFIAAPDVGVPLNDQFLPDLPIVWEAIVGEEARRRVEDKGTGANDESKIISAGGPLSIVGCESEGVKFEEAVGKVGLISETETALDTTRLPIC